MKVSLQHVFKSIRGEPLKIQLDPTKPELTVITAGKEVVKRLGGTMVEIQE